MKALLFSLFIISSFLASSTLVVESRYLSDISPLLSVWAKNSKGPNVVSIQEKALEKARLYISLIQKNHLVHGMIANKRIISGQALDLCDSLLFSSLYFVSLTKLHYDKEAKEVWEAIKKNTFKDSIRRHPLCAHQSTSRDMVVGLFVALSQKPAGYETVFKRFVDTIEKNNGYFSGGPFYLSYLTPGLRHYLSLLAPPTYSLEDPFWAFSTLEFSTLYTKGYQSHLIALQVWLELELKKTLPPGPIGWLDLLNPVTKEPMSLQRLKWISSKLAEVNPRNIFFQWLMRESFGLFNNATRNELLERLVNMTEFPENRLPLNCDRHADYLWQRDHSEYSPDQHCSKRLSGVDYLWALALILDKN